MPHDIFGKAVVKSVRSVPFIAQRNITTELFRIRAPHLKHSQWITRHHSAISTAYGIKQCAAVANALFPLGPEQLRVAKRPFDIVVGPAFHALAFSTAYSFAEAGRVGKRITGKRSSSWVPMCSFQYKSGMALQLKEEDQFSIKPRFGVASNQFDTEVTATHSQYCRPQCFDTPVDVLLGSGGRSAKDCRRHINHHWLTPSLKRLGPPVARAHDLDDPLEGWFDTR